MLGADVRAPCMSDLDYPSSHTYRSDSVARLGLQPRSFALRLVLDEGLIDRAVMSDGVAFVLGADLFLPLLGSMLLDGLDEGHDVVVDGVERRSVGPIVGSVADDRCGVGDLVTVSVTSIRSR